MREFTVFVTTSVFAASLGLASCSSGGSEGGSEEFSLLANDSSVVTTPGNSGMVAFSVTQGSAGGDTVTLSLESVPTGFTASITPTTLTEGTAVLSYDVGGGVGDGSFDIVVGAATSTSSVTRTVTVHTLPTSSSSGLTLDVPAAMSIRAGRATATLIEVSRDAGVTGSISFSASGAPAGMTVSFTEPTTATNSSVMRMVTTPSVAPGTYAIQVDATNDSNQATAHVLAKVIDTSAAADIWVNRVELAQSYFSNDPTLVSGKRALVRAHVLSDGIATSSPVVEAIARNGGTEVGRRMLSGPSFVPNSETPEMLDMSYTAEMPQAWVEPGLQIEIVVDPSDLVADDREPSNDSKLTSVNVVIGPEINLVVVPLVVNGRTPTPADYHDDMFKRWPLRSINITTRAAYTVTSVSDVQPDGTGWNEVLNELAALRSSDGSTAYYYGALDLTYNSGVFGLGFVGAGASIGADFSVPTMLHEVGHNFSLQHAPCGGAQGVDSNYPHTGGICGTYGYDLLDGDLFEPDATNDLMGYCGTRWISGYNYGLVRDRLVAQSQVQPLLAQASQTPEPLVTVSGWISKSGAVTFGNTRRSVGIAPKTGGENRDGGHRLQAAFGDGSVTTHSVSAWQIGCGKPNPRGDYFTITIPDRSGLHAIAMVDAAGRELARHMDSFDVTMVDSIVQSEEVGETLSVSWNATAYPELSVVHVGPAGRTTLALDLRGGAATLSTRELPAGGSFEFSLTHDLAGRCECIAR